MNAKSILISIFYFISQIENSSKLQIVEHVTSIDWGCLAILCNGYIEIDGSKELHIHPKFSPYKVYAKAIIAPEDDETIQRDLNDLTLYQKFLNMWILVRANFNK